MAFDPVHLADVVLEVGEVLVVVFLAAAVVGGDVPVEQEEIGQGHHGGEMVEFGLVITSYSIHYTKLYDAAGSMASWRPWPKIPSPHRRWQPCPRSPSTSYNFV